MKTYKVILTPRAHSDLKSLKKVIKEQFHAPLTAKRYLIELQAEIHTLSYLADMRPIENSLSIRYGLEIRSIFYKEMTILYNIQNGAVYIQRVLPQKMVLY